MVFGPPGAFGGKGAFGAAQGGAGAGGGGSGGFGYSPAQFGLTAPKGGYATPGGGTDPGSRGLRSSLIAAKQKALANTKDASDRSKAALAKHNVPKQQENLHSLHPFSMQYSDAKDALADSIVSAKKDGYVPGAISHHNQINNMFTPDIFGNETLALADARDPTNHITVQNLGDMTTNQYNSRIGQNPHIGHVGDPDKGFGPMAMALAPSLFGPVASTAFGIASSFANPNPYTGSKRSTGLGSFIGLSSRKAKPPTVTAQPTTDKRNKKRGGRTSNKNYSKGGGVRSAKY